MLSELSGGAGVLGSPEGVSQTSLHILTTPEYREHGASSGCDFVSLAP